MSRRAIAHSPDLARLREAGYELQVHPKGFLLVNSVPSVKAEGTLGYGTLIVKIVSWIGDRVGAPENHQAYFRGEFPHKKAGERIDVLTHASQLYLLAEGLEAHHYFSYKSDKIQANGHYADYFDLVTSYIDLIEKYARRVDENVTARTGRAFDLDDEESVFVYRDTASTRAGIMAVSQRLEDHVVAIIGLGGTGSYVLDLLAKTPVKEIRLYDGDFFLQHNAFRAPGAAKIAEVAAVPPLRKVDYLRAKYAEMHRGIVARPVNVYEIGDEFADIDFAFVCLDPVPAKRAIIEGLVARDKTFIDVGVGIFMEGTSLGGKVRTTLSAPGRRTHRHPIPFVDVKDEYPTNIQIADLNALNAALAVLRWKKHLGFYLGILPEPEFSSSYTIEFNEIDNGTG